MNAEEKNIMMLLEEEIKKQARKYFDEVKFEIQDKISEKLYSCHIWTSGISTGRGAMISKLNKLFSESENDILPTIEKFYRNIMLHNIKKLQ